MAGKKSPGKSKPAARVTTKKVSFEFPAADAQKVYLAGSFNNWDTSTSLMKKDSNGIWKTTVSLKPGRYEYRFLRDGSWENDPSCCDCVPNEFGSENCVRIVE